MEQVIASYFEGFTSQFVYACLFAAGIIVTVISLIFGEFGIDTDDEIGNFSVTNLSIFSTVFGGTGFLVHRMINQDVLISSIIAAASGIVVTAIFTSAIKMLKSNQANSLLTEDDYYASSGVISTTIPSNGIGEVTLKVRGTISSRPARGERGKPIERGTHVKVVRYGDVVTVQEM